MTNYQKKLETQISKQNLINNQRDEFKNELKIFKEKYPEICYLFFSLSDGEYQPYFQIDGDYDLINKYDNEFWHQTWSVSPKLRNGELDEPISQEELDKILSKLDFDDFDDLFIAYKKYISFISHYFDQYENLLENIEIINYHDNNIIIDSVNILNNDAFNYLIYDMDNNIIGYHKGNFNKLIINPDYELKSIQIIKVFGDEKGLLINYNNRLYIEGQQYGNDLKLTDGRVIFIKNGTEYHHDINNYLKLRNHGKCGHYNGEFKTYIIEDDGTEVEYNILEIIEMI